MNTAVGPFPTTTAHMNNSALPIASTNAFQLASRMAPHLIASEAPPTLFAQHLPSEHEAAVRLNGYWSHRSLLLGSLCWTSLAESGLLEQQQQQHQQPSPRALRMVRLKNDQGLPPLLVVRARLLGSLIARDLFITLHHAIQQKAASIDVVVQLEDGSSLSKGSILEFIDMAAKLIQASMPFQVNKVHLATTLTDTSMDGATMSSLCLQKVLLSGLAQDCIITTAPSANELTQKLASYHVPWETANGIALPNINNNTTTRANILMLGKIQQPPEGALSFQSEEPSPQAPKTVPTKQRTRRLPTSKTGPVAKDSATKKMKITTTEPQTAAEVSLDSIYTLRREAGVLTTDLPSIPTKRGPKTEEEKRKRNAIYSRRKYVRKKIEFQVLEKESARLQIQNEALAKEQEQLEKSLAQAQQMAADIDSGRMSTTPAATAPFHSPRFLNGTTPALSNSKDASALGLARPAFGSTTGFGFGQSQQQQYSQMCPSSLHQHAALLQQMGGKGIPMPPNSTV